MSTIQRLKRLADEMEPTSYPRQVYQFNTAGSLQLPNGGSHNGERALARAAIEHKQRNISWSIDEALNQLSENKRKVILRAVVALESLEVKEQELKRLRVDHPEMFGFTISSDEETTDA